jgi:anthranilate synthase/aminodeoxychorismate synthase-like glutamine amidotransferase
MRILLLDNLDSFTFNLLHYLEVEGAEVTVVRNNVKTIPNALEYDGVVLSPGPCTPREAGFLMPFVEAYCGKVPMLGVCLGMQAIGLHFHWELTKAREPRHGKPSWIEHNGTGVFQNLSQHLQVGRYHSLIIQPHNNVASELQIDASCEGEIMGVSCPEKKIWAVQFHPESILTPQGHSMISNWIALCAQSAS